jgi:hypothetical protein
MTVSIVVAFDTTVLVFTDDDNEGGLALPLLWRRFEMLDLFELLLLTNGESSMNANVFFKSSKA